MSSVRTATWPRLPCWATQSELEIIPCGVSGEVFAKVVDGAVDGAVLPIENSLHGSVAEHYDLLLEQPVRIVRETCCASGIT